MSLRDELEARRAAGQKCLTCAFISEQTPEDQAEWHELLGDRALATVRLYKLARKRGFPGGQSAFNNHRQDHELDPAA